MLWTPGQNALWHVHANAYQTNVCVISDVYAVMVWSKLATLSGKNNDARCQGIVG